MLTVVQRTGGTPDAVVVGSGPNGLAAAIALAQSGRSVLVVEAAPTIGGGCRSAELTLPGFVHDPCSAIHPLAMASPFFRKLPLNNYGLAWIQPPLPLAHPFDDGTAAILSRSLDETADALGVDARAYRRLMGSFLPEFDSLLEQILGPFRPPHHPVLLARFGLDALRSAAGLATSRFSGARARGLFSGLAAHSMLSLEQPVSAAIALVLGLAGHAVGWPIPSGGSQRIADALAAHLRALGGEIRTGVTVASLDQLPQSAAVLFDVTPRQFLAIAGDAVPGRYRRALGGFRFGPGVFKIDWALAGPVPWTAEVCHLAGTLHLGGTLEEIAAAECDVAAGRHPERPFVLIAQQSRFDPTRAPAGRHTLWGYCHVPNGSTLDMTDRIERQIERFAPGFRDLILARSVLSPAALEDYNPNYVGGDINGGVSDLRQLVTRPTIRRDPYSTPNRRLYLCSSSTPPGGGVHGMCGYFAAQSALRQAW
jgi:phytoene dehydrogenase-like protein